MSFYLIIRGPLGCGKTTLSKKLVATLNAKYFSIDELLDKYNLTEDKEEGYISQKSFKKVNEIIMPLARESLERGIPVIFDGNFYWKSQLDDLLRLDFPHLVFTLKLPLEVCIERDSKRNKPHGELAARAVYKKTFDYGINIDVDRPMDLCVEEIYNTITFSSKIEKS